ncbi:MAG TPA: hypothetical protein VEI01_03900 [Terriglobales bacterium]|nr:hypothetical protein [Terriglobales bacterium]
MVRLLAALFLASLLLLSCGCSGFFFVGGAINPGMQTVSGMVTVVHLSITNGGSSITAVTLAAGGAANTINFCGDQRSQFPMSQFVEASFNPGVPCATLLTIVVG